MVRKSSDVRWELCREVSVSQVRQRGRAYGHLGVGQTTIVTGLVLTPLRATNTGAQGAEQEQE